MFTADSFCKTILGTSYSTGLKSLHKGDYKTFEIPKKNGYREIQYVEKTSPLWNLQNKLLKNFLCKQDLPICVKGFRKGESYKNFLEEHIGSTFFMRIDISNFFPSIDEALIKNELGLILPCNTSEDKENILDIICNITTLNGVLPQGACTSPAISNLVMARLDQRITKYCQIFGIRVTRYADDILFSSTDFDFSQKKWFLKKIKYILSSNKFKLNYSKLKFGKETLTLNGFIISKHEVRLSRNRLSDIRHVIAFARENHDLFSTDKTIFLQRANRLNLKYRKLEEYPFKSLFQFTQFMCGYRAFLISFLDSNYKNTYFQKDLLHLIRKLEAQISFYS